MKSGHSDGKNYIVRGASARKIVERLCKALADGTYRSESAQSFRDLVTDVARVYVGENKYVCASRNAASRRLYGRYRGNESGIELELSVENEIGRAFICHGDRFCDLVHGVGELGIVARKVIKRFRKSFRKTRFDI